MNYKRRNIWLFGLMVLGITGIKHVMVARLPIIAQSSAMFDDLLMVQIAKSLLGGHWLGAYSHLTLIKGITFPLFLAFGVKTGISFITLQTTVYTIACLLFTLAVSPLFKRKLLLLPIYALLLFNPVSFASLTFQRVYRNGLSMSLVLLVVAGMTGLYLRREKAWRSMLPWSIIAMCSLPAFWNTREDGMWILPFVITAAILGLIFTKSVRRNQRIFRFFLMILPLIFLLLTNIFIANVNDAYYGIKTRNELSDSTFTKLLENLYSLKSEESTNRVSVKRQTVRELYSVSPTFATLREKLEFRLDFFQTVGQYSDDKEVMDGWFFWALRWAVSDSGYYTTAQTAENFYKQVNIEIQTAIKNGILHTRATMPSTFLSPWRDIYASQLPDTMLDAAKLMITYKGVESSMETSFGSAKGIETFEAMTNSYAIYPIEKGAKLAGWYIWKPNDATITLSVKIADGTIHPLPLKESTDVDKAYNGIYKNAQTARFAIELSSITADQASELIVNDAKGNLIETLQLTSTNQNAENADRIYRIDLYESINERQTSIKQISAVYVARVNRITDIYQKTGLLFALCGFASFLYLSIIMFIKRKKTKQLELDRFMLLLGFALSLGVLLVGVSYTQISAFDSINYFYLSGGYPLMIAFFALSIASIAESLLDLQNHPKYGKLVTQIYRFVLVGGTAFLIDYGLLIMFIRFLKLHYLFAGTISFCVAVIFNYLMSIFWVFKPTLRNKQHQELIVFLSLSTLGLGINQLAMFTLVDGIGFTISLSKVLATLIVMVYNFISRKKYLERSPIKDVSHPVEL